MWTRTGRVENKAQTMKHQGTCIAGGSWDSGTSINAVNLDLRKDQHRKGLSMYQQRSTCTSLQEPVTPDIPKQKYWQSQCYEPKMSRYVMYPVVQNPFTPQEWIWSSLSLHSESLMIALRSNFLLAYHKPPHTLCDCFKKELSSFAGLATPYRATSPGKVPQCSVSL